MSTATTAPASSRSCASATSWGSSSTRSASTAAKRVGRVPLGTHPRSTLRLAWDLRVNGKPLKAGHYRVTLRALDTKGKVLGLTKPFDLRVK